MTWMSPADQRSSLEASPDVWTVQKVLTWSTNWLKEKCVDRGCVGTNLRLDAELLLGQVLDCDRMRLYLQLDRPLSKEERDIFKTHLRRRVDGEPVHYILGYRDFYRHRFQVDANVLVPRPDTEILVERCLDLLKPIKDASVLDIGTGSGCVGISIALNKHDCGVVAWDISEGAIEIATQNAKALHCENISFELTDVFGVRQFDPVDMIVSNPPYIRRSDEQGLSQAVRKFEPHIALFDDKAADGLTFYRWFAENNMRWIKPGGYLVVECGHDQGVAVRQIFEANGLLDLTITNDLSGVQRVVSGRRI